MNSKWKPPKSPIGMLQEDLWPDVWKILVAFYNRRARSLTRFSSEFDKSNWKVPSDLHGCGKYADECFRVFCTGDWKNVNTSDGSLKRYVAWLWEEEDARRS